MSESDLQINIYFEEAKLARLVGRFDDAVDLCDKVLAARPQDSAVQLEKAANLRSLQKLDEASALLKELLDHDSNNADAHCMLGVLHKQNRRYGLAVASLETALSLNANIEGGKQNLALAYTEWGSALKQQGSLDVAQKKFDKALDVQVSCALAHFNKAEVYNEQGMRAEAVRCYQQALRYNPNYKEAYCNLGVLAKNAGDLNEAIRMYEASLGIDANFTVVRNNLAIALTDLGTATHARDAKLAIRIYKKALSHNARYSEAHYNLGVIYTEIGRTDRALVHYELAVLCTPSHSLSWNNLGALYKNRDNRAMAQHCYEQAIIHNDRFAQPRNNLGVLHIADGSIDKAVECIEAAIKLEPNYADAYNNLGVLLREEGRMEEALQCYRRSLASDPNNDAGHNLMLSMNYVQSVTAQELYQAHVEWGKRWQSRMNDRLRVSPLKNALTARPPPRNSNDRIVIGYLSPDFTLHSVSYFIESLLRYHDRRRFKVICYSNVGKPDTRTLLLQPLAEVWRSVAGVDTVSSAKMIRDDDVDILVELTGHAAGNRLDIVALRPARLQVTYIGYPNTTGLHSVDYRITDGTVDPVESTQPHTEKLIRLPSSFLCYSPPEAPPVSDLPCKSLGVITFGSFNALAKLTDTVMVAWGRIMAQVPGSRLMLKTKSFTSKRCRDGVHKRLADAGISSDRVDLLAMLPERSAHLSLYNRVDIALDTWPYAGTTTTCEALWMGVPVVSHYKVGLHAHCVGRTLLKAIGMPELALDNVDDFVNTAVALASDRVRLAELRSSLRAKISGSSLCDGVTHTKQFEAKMQEIIAALPSK